MRRGFNYLINMLRAVLINLIEGWPRFSSKCQAMLITTIETTFVIPQV
jgi:hypothetical protein